MDKQIFSENSSQFQSFYEQYLNPIVLKIQYASNHAQDKSKKQFLFSLYLICFFIFLQITSHTIFAIYFHSAENWYNNLMLTYAKWFESKPLLGRAFLPSNPFFFGFPYPWKFIIISIFVLIWLCFTPIFKARLNKIDIFQNFFLYIDPNTKFLNHQQLKYLFNITDFFALPTHDLLTLEDNTEFHLNNHLFNFAQINLSNNSDSPKFLKFLLPKFQICYKGLIIIGLVPQKNERFIKIFIDHNNEIDFSTYRTLEEINFLDNNISKRVKIFTNQRDLVIKEKIIKEILENVSVIQQVNFAVPIYFDQVITDKLLENTSERSIQAYNYMEITVTDDLAAVLIPTNHKLFSFKSCFASVDIQNDYNIVFAGLNIASELVKMLQ